MRIHTDRLNEVLDSWIERHDISDYPVTVRNYLVLLLRRLWIEGEGFSGKKPFGNLGWKYDIYTSLVLNGFIPGRIGDDDEGLVEFDRKQADDLIYQCIYLLSRRPE